MQEWCSEGEEESFRKSGLTDGWSLDLKKNQKNQAPFKEGWFLNGNWEKVVLQRGGLWKCFLSALKEGLSFKGKSLRKNGLKEDWSLEGKSFFLKEGGLLPGMIFHQEYIWPLHYN